ncbi:MAG: cobyric acid synthase, partial [Muribaculaceae bacterium]|nr:cobyric acid synthase [Muribaculaceae bacterium]
SAREAGKSVIGICGGYQMMGTMISDPDGVEGGIRELPGLGLLPVSTVLTVTKTTRQVQFRLFDSEEICEGYEIHMGHTESSSPLTRNTDGGEDGCFVDERCFGSYIHGILDNSVVLDYILNPYRTQSFKTDFDYRSFKESQYDALAAWLREYIDIDRLYKIMMAYD